MQGVLMKNFGNRVLAKLLKLENKYIYIYLEDIAVQFITKLHCTNINNIFLSKISTIASKPAATFMSSDTIKTKLLYLQDPYGHDCWLGGYSGNFGQKHGV